jgi:hypothetical protein
MAVRDDPPAAVEEIGRGRVGPIGIVLTATVLLLGTILLLYALIQFWPPSPRRPAPARRSQPVARPPGPRGGGR